jgi:hypothetical protein
MKVAACTLLFLSLVTPMHAETRVYILSGQSNASGYGVPSELTAPYNSPDANVKLWSSDVGSWTALSPVSNWFGSEISFGRDMAAAYPDDQICIIKYIGTSGFCDNWQLDPPGYCYTNLMATIDAAMAGLTAQNLSPVFSGFLWQHGESDATHSHDSAAAYQANLAEFIAMVRHDLDAADLQFAIGRKNLYWGGSGGDSGLVRAAQMTVPGIVGHASWFNTDDLPVYTDGVLQGHFNSAGLIELGHRYAQQFMAFPGDANLDGTVNGADLNIVLSNYNTAFTPGTAWGYGDFNGDGIVNGADLNTVLSNYNQSNGVTAAVPEPCTLTLFGIGAIGLLAYAWRRRRV